MRQDFRENLALALDTLPTHKLRSLLTVLGVVIGVGVIILVGALLTGFSQDISEQITGYGADTARIARFHQGPPIGRRPKEERLRKPLTVEDGEAVLEACTAVERAAVSIFHWEVPHKVRYREDEVQGIEFRGTFPSFVQVYANAAMKEGRFFTASENLHRQKVVVIGENVAKALFPQVDAVGKEVLIDGSAFLVIGVFQKPKGGFGMNDEDRRVVIPYWSFRKLYPAAYEHGIRIQAYPGRLDLAVDQAREVLRRRRNVAYGKPDTFSIQTQLEAVEKFNEIIGGVALAMVVLSSIGLLIGGVGVMNIMLVSVTERTREIGIRKAIGARRRDITWQFLLEAMALTGTGGVIGILAAGGLVLLIPVVTEMKATVPLWSVAAGLAVSVTVGLIFGVWPALKAARLDPVEALRYE
jgi:ABC-type antimicrobial peptide transport system permease subunit